MDRYKKIQRDDELMTLAHIRTMTLGIRYYTALTIDNSQNSRAKPNIKISCKAESTPGTCVRITCFFSTSLKTHTTNINYNAHSLVVAWWRNAQGIGKGDEHPACTCDQEVAD